MSTISPSRFGCLGGDAGLQLPLPGLLADLDSGDASIAMTDEFTDSPPAVRVRALQNWIGGLRQLKDAAVVAMFREAAHSRPGLNIVDQIDEFRRDCAEAGVTCPADLFVLLQRF